MPTEFGFRLRAKRSLMSETILENPPYTKLGHNESVVLHSSYGHLTESGRQWRVALSGTVYQPDLVRLRMRILMRLLRRVMKVAPDQFESELFRNRIRHFIAATERGKRIAVRFGDHVHRLRRKSRRNGYFSGAVRLGHEQVEQLGMLGHVEDGWVRFELAVPEYDGRTFVGRAQLIEPEGISIVSDIDDTLKQTLVTDRREMLANTFLREFRPIDGMSRVFRSWSASGCAFHYVSSSPWQLYHPLEEFCEAEAFPAGSMHLRSFRLRDHMLRRLLLIRRKGKSKVIASLMARFPRRQFILVGDSGEHDPEIYGRLARQFGSHVRMILIRELPERPLDAQRREKAFRGLAPHRLRIFEHPSELAAQTEVLGLAR